MFLKSIEMNGFKSFAQKTSLEFPKGITAIVGPNGSGKSNVIDAIRWILGEREAKNLRGGKAEDLIFAGTPKKPRSGMAQVGIYFDNSSKFFPVEFDEVSVVREINRDGNSTYYLNKTEARAKDVIDFFARARLGTRGITIINQGSSDLFVRATPAERRFMIEEVLGLKEYQLKKAEAERKLKATYINLDKIKLMTEEVLPRLRMLKRQVSKFQTLGDKKSELEQIEDSYFSHKAYELKNKLHENSVQINDFEARIKEKNKELSVLQEELSKIENTKKQDSHHTHDSTKENELYSHRNQLQKDLGRLEARIEFLAAYSDSDEDVFKKEEMLSLLRDTKKAIEESVNSNSLESALSNLKIILLKIDEFFGRPSAKNMQKSKEVEELEKEKNKIAEQLAVIDKELNAIKSSQEGFTKGLEEFNQKFKHAFALTEAKKDEIRKLDTQKQYITFDNEKLQARLEDLKAEWLRNERSIEEFEKLKPQHEKMNDFESLERQIFKLRAEILSIGEIDESLIKEAQEVEQHYNNLSTQLEDLEKASGDLKNLIEQLKKEIDIKFTTAFKEINDEFNNFFKLMFGGGSAKLKIAVGKKQKEISENEDAASVSEDEEEQVKQVGIEIELSIPKKRIASLDVLSGGEKSLVSIAALFALISVSPPPFLVLDEIDAPLDEKNSTRFANLVKEFAHKVQFIIVTHNRTIMETADVLYGVTMNDDGTSKLLSLKLE